MTRILDARCGRFCIGCDEGVVWLSSRNLGISGVKE